MSKNTIYLAIILLALIVIVTVMSPKKTQDIPPQVTNPTAFPANGLVSAPPPTTAPAANAVTTGAPSPESNPAMPAPAPLSPKDKAMDADDVPLGAEVSGEGNAAPAAALPNVPKPDDNKGMAIPPSEGQ